MLIMSHQARKRFGQNFLHDAAIIVQLVSSIMASCPKRLIEIGPGLGALTYPLLKESKNLSVIEIDRDLAAILRNKGLEGLEVIEKDALEVDFKQFAEKGKISIVGNLPYNISTPLIFHLFKFCGVIDEMFFMLQKEVVERMAAQPHTKCYGRLSIMAQYFCEVTPLFSIPPQAFSPEPKVDSMWVKLKPWAVSPYPMVKDHQRFSYLVQQAFSHRRKTLRNALSKTDANIPLSLLSKRPEELAIADFIAL